MFVRPKDTYKINFDLLNHNDFVNDKSNPIGNIISKLPLRCTVLDIGAGNGLLGCLISKIKPNILIDGVEPSIEAALLAKSYYRTFYNDYFQNVSNEIFKNSYDFIILADVIEHVIDPLGFLLEIKKCIPEECRIILSIPNVAHGSVRLSVLNGIFNYENSGLLEKTHLRFFTFNTIEELFQKAGLNVESVDFLQRSFEFGKKWAIKPSLISQYKMLRDVHALTYQYLVVVRKGPKNDTITKNYIGNFGSLKYLIKTIVKGFF